MTEPKKRAPRRKQATEEFERDHVELQNENVNDVSAREVVLRSVSARDIKAEVVAVTQGGVNAIDAKSVSVTQGGVVQASAGELSLKQGGIVKAEADEIEVTQGGIAFAQAEQIELEAGGAVALLGTDIHVEAGGAQWMLARESIQVQQGRRGGDGSAAHSGREWRRGLCHRARGAGQHPRALRCTRRARLWYCGGNRAGNDRAWTAQVAERMYLI
jgi:hypothetical protein